MYDVSPELRTFYKEHVRLGTDRRNELAKSRDACVTCLCDGLKTLSTEGTTKAGPIVDTVNQGSYAMHTLNQQANDDYDIDVGVICESGALPDSALDARKRVLEGFARGTGGTFAKDPETRTNAVTVWYSQGYHVDLAVYRRVSPAWGSPYLEHAGSTWTKRDPNEVLNWFTQRVKDKEPSTFWGTSIVEPQQLRRAVRFVKAFCRSRASWDLPGGMIITALVVEIFDGDPKRDDLALYATLVALRDRLRRNADVNSPIDGSSLTVRPKFQGQVRRLLQRLEETLPKLAVLHDSRCTKDEALAAWDAVFRHKFWGDASEEAEVEAVTRLGVAPIAVDVAVAKSKGGAIMYPYREIGPVLPKNVGLKFSVRDATGLDRTEVTWSVRNSGDEAKEAGDLEHATTGAVSDVHWESTLYKGVHTMICEARRDGRLVGRGTRRIRVGSR
jgi:hypothetical protein